MKEGNIRPDNLLKAMGIDFKGLDEEEREMQKLLVESYREKGKSFFEEIKKWREANAEATLGQAIRALYNNEENL